MSEISHREVRHALGSGHDHRQNSLGPELRAAGQTAATRRAVS